MEKEELVLEVYNLLKEKNLIKIKEFEKNELVANYIYNRNYLYIVLNGSCTLFRYHRNGDIHLHQRYERYDVFGELFHEIELSSEQSVYANTKLSVGICDYDELVERKDTVKIKLLLNELFILTMRDMNNRIEVVTRKTIRDRILSYFDILSKRRTLKQFEIPMSYTHLASYLGVDRSAMMREISDLEKDRVIVKNKRKIFFKK